jgi:hydrogenase maturation factor
MSHLGNLGTDLAAASLALARRFAAGGTMWCSAPAWPQHAHHVAVEFVHPVIVGKRALAAVVVPEPDPVPSLRTLARSGDVFLAIAPASDAAVIAAMRRCQAWGLESVWIGAGERPEPGAADHVLWLRTPEDTAAVAGNFVLLYHLLWELTHVCFEHPGLLRPPAGDIGGEVCITCRDEGHLGEVLAQPAGTSARVRTPTGVEAIDTSLVGPVAAGDLVLVHAGLAIGQIDPNGPQAAAGAAASANQGATAR